MSRHSSPWSQWPPALLEEFRKEIGRLVEGVFESPEGGRLMVPSVNVAETDQGFEITVDLPGVQPQDVQIEVREGQLCIAGERHTEPEDKSRTYHRQERRAGRFRRMIPLGTNIDVEKVEACCRDGVLTVRIPKSQASLPRRITVRGE